MVRIILRELRANLKSFLIWSVSIIIIVALMMSEFSAYYDNPDMAAIIEAIPEAMKEALSFNTGNLTTVIGFTTMASMYMFIAVGMYGALQGANILAKEERDKTAEFFYTLPISREQVLVSKISAGVILCLLLSIVTALALIITALPYELEDNYFNFMAYMTFGMFFLSSIFMALGMMMASILKRYKQSGNITIFIVIASYLMTIFMGISDKLAFFKYITPFHFVNVSYYVQHQAMNWDYLWIGLIMFVVAIIVTFITYPRRDLHI